MTSLIVKQASVKDAIGRVRAGWIIFEDGQPGYPFATKEQAVKQAEALGSLSVALWAKRHRSRWIEA